MIHSQQVIQFSNDWKGFCISPYHSPLLNPVDIILCIRVGGKNGDFYNRSPSSFATSLQINTPEIFYQNKGKFWGGLYLPDFPFPYSYSSVLIDFHG